MINYKVLEVGYALVGRDACPAELVFDYDLKSGPMKCLRVKSQTSGGRYGDGWWCYDLSAFIFIPSPRQITLIGV